MDLTIPTRAEVFALAARRLRERLGGVRILALPDAVYDSQHMGSFNLVVVTDSPEIVDEVMGELSLELCDVLDEAVLAATVTEEQFVNETTGTARQARRRGVAL